MSTKAGQLQWLKAGGQYFTVTMSGTVADQDVTLQYATEAVTATEGTDYTAPAAGSTVTIPAGQRTAAFTVETRPDTTDEDDDETFTVRLTGWICRTAWYLRLRRQRRR